MDKISIVIPIYNEKDNIIPLHKKIRETTKDSEIIFVDDGSRDGSDKIIKEIIKKDKNVKLIQFRRNFGQTSALMAGFREAKNSIIISMDGDLQNDPSDIPRLVEKLNEGYDCVAGWRKNRKDPFGKRMASRIAYIIRKILMKDNTHDPGCTLKAFRAEAIKELKLYGETHRFIPAILTKEGYKVAEMVVKHHPRYKGRTKYSAKRFINGIMDIITIQFWGQYHTKPLHILGRFGLWSFIIAGLMLLYNLIRYWPLKEIGPTLAISIVLFILGIQFIIFGIMIDILMKIYFDSTPYDIKEIYTKK